MFLGSFAARSAVIFSSLTSFETSTSFFSFLGLLNFLGFGTASFLLMFSFSKDGFFSTISLGSDILGLSDFGFLADLFCLSSAEF